MKHTVYSETSFNKPTNKIKNLFIKNKSFGVGRSQYYRYIAAKGGYWSHPQSVQGFLA